MAHLCDLSEVLDRFGDRSHRRLPDAEKPIGRTLAELLQPAVVRPHRCVLVIRVRMVAEQHADGRVDDFRADAVAVLVEQPGLRVPAAARHLLEAAALGLHFGEGFAGRSDAIDAEAVIPPLHHINVLALGVALDMRRLVPEGGIDIVDITVGRLGDMAIGGNRDDLLQSAGRHRITPC